MLDFCWGRDFKKDCVQSTQNKNKITKEVPKSPMKETQQLFFVQEGQVNKNGHQWREGKSDKTRQVVLMSTTCSLFLHCFPQQQRAMETHRSMGLSPPLIFKTLMHVKGSSFICDASCELSPRSPKFPFFLVPLELKWFLCAKFSLP